jgi:hypothetical protein
MLPLPPKGTGAHQNPARQYQKRFESHCLTSSSIKQDR